MSVVAHLTDRGAVENLVHASAYDLMAVEPMPLAEWNGTKTQIALVTVLGDTAGAGPDLRFLCLARKGPRAADRFAKVKFSRVLAFDPLPVQHLERVLRDATWRTFSDRVDLPGREIPPATWRQVRAELVRVRPAVAAHLARLEAGLSTPADMSEHRQQILQQEKDATGVALTVAKMPRTPLERWEPTSSPAPFLSGITPGTAREDVLVIHDAGRAPGWASFSEPYVGVTEFRDRRGQQLTVMNVNRHPLEEVTGVDLLYYRHEPESFALVQYKRMRRTSRSLGFRPSSDDSLKRELERMRAVEALAGEPMVRGREDRDSVAEYRLHPQVCWLKLCKPDAFKPSGSDLVSGMYLPLDYWDTLVGSGQPTGVRGGTFLGYDTVDRWVNNTLFTQLMSEGWIGSRGVQTEWLTQTVEQSLSDRRSVVLAHEAPRERRRRRDR